MTMKHETENLEEKYGLPYGRLYIAFFNKEVAGCIALRKIDNENCELKRLYVKPEYRGKNIGSYLVKHIIKDAKEIGYKHILLDTLPFLETAINMYKKYGSIENHGRDYVGNKDMEYEDNFCELLG